MANGSSQKQIGYNAAKVAKEGIGVGLDHENVQGLQEAGRLGALINGRGRRGGRQDFHGQSPNDLFGAKNGKGHAHQIQTGAHRNVLAEHVGRLDAGGGLAQEPPREPAGCPGPKDGYQTQGNAGSGQKVVGQQGGLAGRAGFEVQDVSCKQERDARDGGENHLCPPGQKGDAFHSEGHQFHQGIDLGALFRFFKVVLVFVREASLQANLVARSRSGIKQVQLEGGLGFLLMVAAWLLVLLALSLGHRREVIISGPGLKESFAWCKAFGSSGGGYRCKGKGLRRQRQDAERKKEHVIMERLRHGGWDEAVEAYR